MVGVLGRCSMKSPDPRLLSRCELCLVGVVGMRSRCAWLSICPGVFDVSLFPVVCPARA